MKLRLPTTLAPAALLALGLVFQAPAFAAPEGNAQSIVESAEHAVQETAAALEGVAHSDEVVHADDAHGESHRGLTSTVLSEMIWTIVVFAIFFAVLSTVVWPKILAGLKAREDKQRADLFSAEKASKDAQATLVEYQKQLAEARQESQRIVAEARGAAQQAANADKARIEAEITSMKTSAKAEIAAAKESALNDIYAQAASLSTAIAGKILQRELNPQDQQALVNQSLDQLRSNANSN